MISRCMDPILHHMPSQLVQSIRRCEEKNLVMNWEKCHFIVNDRIVLGHKVSAASIVVDRAKIEVMTGLPTPANVKDVRSFSFSSCSYY